MQGADIAGEATHQTKGLLRLTMACNERCPFCNVPAEDYERLTPPQEETFGELDAFLATGAQTLTISGGEPTLLRKRLLATCARAVAGGIRFIELQTNATLIDATYAQQLAAAGVTSAFVSLLSHVAEHHDALAGLPGAFPKCLAGIDAMVDAGIRVTLNPVTAYRTQGLVADYVDFVAARLPAVRFISMSAVQPHGRARDDVDLLPDYAVLRTSIQAARERAAAHGIELINPYCGLPVCVGWADDLTCSVEAFEATQGGWRDTPGLDNVGNKSHGAPCRRCALRTRCGGAWHAYWEVRGGSGIAAPWATVEPWCEGAEDAAGQAVLRCAGSWPAGLLAAADPEVPTTWLWTDTLTPADVSPLLRSRVTDLALELTTLDPDALKDTLRAVRRLVQAGRDAQPTLRLRVHVGVRPPPGAAPAAVARAASLALVLGVDSARVLASDGRWARLVTVLRTQHPDADLDAPVARPLAGTPTGTL